MLVPLRTAKSPVHLVVILTGGEGTRLSPYWQRPGGDSLPKQYLKTLGGRSIFEATLERAETLAPPERQHVVMAQSHFKFPEVTQQLQGFPYTRVSVQPLSQDTGLSLLLPLASLYRQQPRASVVVMTSDYFIDDENLFHSHVEAACRLVEWQEQKIILLGITPNAPETKYGYILARNHWQNASTFDAREVSRLVEKPGPILARKLIRQGGYWNSKVMVFKIATLVEHARAVSPAIYQGFERICSAIGRPNFAQSLRQVFTQTAALNLSKGLLEPLATRPEHPLLVLPVRGNWIEKSSELREMNPLAHFNDKHGVIA